MFGGSGISLADIAAVTKGNNNNGDSFGGNNGWWILIILFALFGWGRGGYGDNAGNGNGGGNAQPVVYPVSADMQRGFDNASVINKLDGLSNGLCSLGYDQLSQMNNLSAQMQQCCRNLENMVQQASFNNTTATNALANQLQQCCCDIRAGQAQAEYNRATDTCTITTAIDRMADRIIQNDNNNFRSLYDQQVSLQMQAKDQQIAALQQRLTTCDMQNMISANGQYVVNTLQPVPRPAYIVANPNGCCNNVPTNCCNNNGGWTYGF